MEELNKEINSKKLLLLIAAISTFVIVAVLIITIALKKEKPRNPVAPIVPKEKTMDEIMKDLTAPAKDGEKAAPVSDEVIKSLTAPVSANSGTATGSKKSKTVQPAPTPVSEDVINSLTAPAAE